MPMRRVRRTFRSRTVRRPWTRAAIAGAGSAVAGIGRKAYKAVRSMQNARSAVRAATAAVARYGKSKSIGNALFGGGAGGDYTQFQTNKLKSGYKKKVNIKSLTKEVRSKNETTIFRFQGVKAFDDWGSYWMSKYDAGGINTYLPMYIYDLTAVNNVDRTGTPISAIPFGRFYMDNATGTVLFNNQFGQSPDGGGSLYLQTEKAGSASSQLQLPHNKSRLLWNQVALSLWGAKQKAVKYTIQVVKLDERCDPFEMNTQPAGPDKNTCQGFWQSLIKPLTYNPIAYVNPQHYRYMKVLKTYTTIIQPTTTTENDADPHSVVLKWFMRWDRDLNYRTNTKVFANSANLLDEPDYQVQVSENTTVPDSKSKIFLFIRATNYKTDVGESSTLSGSFDMMVRSCHAPM